MFKKALVPVIVGILLLGTTAMSFAKSCDSCSCGCGGQKTSCETCKTCE